MSVVEKLALCITLLPAASCLMDDPGPEPDLAQRPLPLEETYPTCVGTPWGDIRVTVTAGTFGFVVDPCKLFDGDTAQFAVVAGAGVGRTKLDIEFLQNDALVAKTLTGFQTHVGGTDESPAGQRFEIVAPCQEGTTTFPDYRGRANKSVALAFRSRCTASQFSIRLWRQDTVGDLEHFAELTPILYGAQPAVAGGGQTPVSGDHYNLLTDPNVNRCEASGIFRSANITSLVTGAPVGTIELHRSRCTKHPSGTPVDIYFARARNDAGLWSGEIGSVYLKITTANGTFQNHKSTVSTPSTSASLRSNAWVHEPDDADTLSVTACGTSYPTATSTTGDATSSGCTTAFALP